MNAVRWSSVVRSWIPGGLLVVWTVTGSGLLTTTAQAEWYVGGYGGISAPGSLSNVTVSDATLGGGVTNARINDLELKSGLLGGVKGGYFFESRPWLGIETDLYTMKPDVKQQTIVGGTSSGSVFAANMPTTSLRLSCLGCELDHPLAVNERCLSTLWRHRVRIVLCYRLTGWTVEHPSESWISVRCRCPVCVDTGMGVVRRIQVQQHGDQV